MFIINAWVVHILFFLKTYCPLVMRINLIILHIPYLKENYDAMVDNFFKKCEVLGSNLL
jgi:hypothetical protein